MSYVNLTKTGTNHTIWMKGLGFYRDELEVMTKRLLDVSVKNTMAEATVGVEHFQNQFFIQQKNISDLKHDVRKYLMTLSEDAREHEGHVDELFVARSKDLEQRYEQQEMIMNGLRREFNDYLCKWL